MWKLLLTVLIPVLFCNKQGTHDNFSNESLDTSEEVIATGKNLAVKYCTQCHIFPDGNLLTQESYNYTLSYMGLFMGFDSSGNLSDPVEIKHFQNRFRLLQKTGRIPNSPVLPKSDFATLRNYFLVKASFDPPPAFNVSPISGTLPKFIFNDKVVTLLKKIEHTENIAVGSGLRNTLQIFDRQFTTVLEASFSSPPVDVQFNEGTYYVVTLGDLLGGIGSEKKAELWAINTKNKKKILGGLTRATQVLLHDMNGDGRKDFLISAFGNQEDGELAWYESVGGELKRHILVQNASVVRAAILTKPGVFPVKIAALHAGAREQLVLYIVDGHRTKSTVLETFAPSFGSVWIETADLDGDKAEELLVLSGDNADCGPYNAIKPYQGLRIYSLKNDTLSLLDFYPVQGALSLSVKPPSGQKKTQILVLSYYADVRAPRDMVILTKEGTGRFSEKSYFMNSRATVGMWLSSTDSVLVGSGNIPMRQRVGKTLQIRQFNGPALQEFFIP